MMVRRAALALITTWLLCPAAELKRPRILGIAHMALYVSDLSKARAFYKDWLGFEEPFALKGADGADRIAFIKINDVQYLELFAEPPKGDGQLNHISFYTEDVRALRDYLAAGGVKTPPGVSKGRTGNLSFTVADPDGHSIEFVEYQPDSWTARAKGKFMPPSRISTHMSHFGVLIGALKPAMDFYAGLLGFQETWRGGSGRFLSWVNMRVPEGEDYLEFMLYLTPPEPQQRGVRNHICLLTPDLAQAVAQLEARAARKQYKRPIEIRVGANRKRLANLYDPDGTRVELMEPDTIDGLPAPSSLLPPPR